MRRRGRANHAGLLLVVAALAAAAAGKLLTGCGSVVDLGVLLSRGDAALGAGDAEAGAACFARAAELFPTSAAAAAGEGKARAELGEATEATARFARALELSRGEGRPAVLAHAGLASLAERTGDNAEAERRLVAAAKAGPSEPAVWFELGVARTRLGEYGPAGDAFAEAARLAPGNAVAHANLGAMRFGTGDFAGAVDALQTATSLEDGNAGHWKNLGSALAKDEQWAPSAAAFDRALALDPQDDVTRVRRLHVRQRACDWRGLDADLDFMAKHADLLSPFDALALPLAPDVLRTTSRKAAREAVQRAGRRLPPPPERSLPLGRRLRVGYVSSDFREHPVGYIMRHVLAHHRAGGAVEAVAYALNPNNTSVERELIADAAERFVDLHPLTDAEKAVRVRQDDVDVLVNLNGYTLTARSEVFEARPAPLQVLYLGYAASLESPAAVPYVVADPVAAPPDLAAQFAERVARLPGLMLPAHHAEHFPTVAPGEDEAGRARYGLPARGEGFVFCCFNALYKTDRGAFAAWMQALHRTPGSVLWLPSGEGAQVTLRAEAAAAGVDPGRLVFQPWLDDEEYLPSRAQCDLFLDSPVYNAHVTALDTAWAGVPSLTLPGEKLASRISTSVGTALGAGRAVRSLLEYEDAAVALATDAEAHGELRAAVTEGRDAPGGPFDLELHVRRLERTLTMAYELRLAGLGPHHLQAS